MTSLEMDDIQGLIVRGYDLSAACFILLRIEEAEAGRNYLKSVLNKITPASKKPTDFALHLAFTNAGLKKLNVPDSNYKFSREFREGMTEKIRSLLLGDVNESSPDVWEWGGPKNEEIHFILLLYAKDKETLKNLISEQKQSFLQFKISILTTKETYKNPLSKEHFGFRDGISQPAMEGLCGRGEKKDVKEPIKAGEFVLGYRNEYCQFNQTPLIYNSDDAMNILPESRELKGFKDLGKNGSYLVYREITQDVYKFWKYLKDNSTEPAATEIEAAIKLGAKMIGRWPGGAPLVTSAFDNSLHSTFNHFSYWKEDRNGEKCPFGAHIRRANPRDQLFSGRDFETSKQMIRKHQILRRGRFFGKPLVETMDPKEILAAGDDGVKRGLHFVCLVGDISRQFEFVQNVWLNNPVFADLYNDVDPIIGRNPIDKEISNKDFTCQTGSVRRKYKDIPQFTRVVGGAYFFLPGIKALHFIANADLPSSALHPTEKDLAKEQHHDNEEEIIEDVICILKKSLIRDYGKGKFKRRLHAKSIGLLAAKLKVESTLEQSLQVGVFKPGKAYDAWIRFSNASPKASADYNKCVRGMAIKILDVDGDRIDTDEFGNTQDIILTNNKIVFPGTIALQKIAMQGLFVCKLYSVLLLLSFRFRGLLTLIRSLVKLPNVLEATYYSGSPTLFGRGKAVKWKAEPLKPKKSQIPEKPHKDFLRERLTKDLQTQDYQFELFVQLQQDAEKEPIEDCSVEWKTSFIKVATLTILKQDFNTEERNELEKRIIFSSWNSIAEHRPLSGVNRLRRKVYLELSRFRKQHNEEV